MSIQVFVLSLGETEVSIADADATLAALQQGNRGLNVRLKALESERARRKS